MRNAVLSMAALACASFSTSASANYWCTGTVSNSYVTPNGAVVMLGSWAPNYTMICSLRETWKGVPPEVCVAWLAKVDSAVALGRSMTVYYAGETPCNTLASYDTAPAPGYVMLQ